MRFMVKRTLIRQVLTGKKCPQQLTEHIKHFLDQGTQDHIDQTPTRYGGASKYEKTAKNTDESNFST
jgi:hypothetical protein